MGFRSLIAVALLVASTALGQSPGTDSLFPEHPTGFVTDVADVLSDSFETVLADRTRDVQKRLGGDIATVTLPTIKDYEPYEVAKEVGRVWGVGGTGAPGVEQRNLGVVILIVPKTAEHKGQCYISTGKGAEGFITDATAGSICRDAIPYFKRGDYGAGVNAISEDVAHRMDEHVHPPPPPPPFDWGGFWRGTGWTILFFAGVAIPLIYWFHKKRLQQEAEYRQQLLAADAERRRDAARREEENARMREAQVQRDKQEAARRAALTPEQRNAEDTAYAASVAAALAAARLAEEERKKRRKKQQEEDDEESSRRSSGSSYSGGRSSYDSGGSSSSGGSSDSFGGGGGFDGGGGGSSW